jgi:hypothetical protein
MKEEGEIQCLTFVDQMIGVHGDTIIKKLMQGSSSFQDRTEFSKQKYIKKKMSKSVFCVTINNLLDTLHL